MTASGQDPRVEALAAVLYSHTWHEASDESRARMCEVAAAVLAQLDAVDPIRQASLVRTGVWKIAVERSRQQRKYSLEHDVTHGPEVLYDAAFAVLNDAEAAWPFPTGWQDRTFEERMIVAGALLAAGLDVEDARVGAGEGHGVSGD